jgi:hypothetical protein
MFIPNATNAVALAGGGKRKTGAPLGTPFLSFGLTALPSVAAAHQ